MMLFMTLGMLRESEAVSLEFRNVSILELRGEEYLSLLVVMSKTDQIDTQCSLQGRKICGYAQ